MVTVRNFAEIHFTVIKGRLIFPDTYTRMIHVIYRKYEVTRSPGNPSYPERKPEPLCLNYIKYRPSYESDSRTKGAIHYL